MPENLDNWTEDENKKYKSEVREVEERDDSYYYTFRPDMTVRDVNEMPKKVADQIVKVLRPRGGGMQMMKAYALSRGQDGEAERVTVTVAGMNIPKTVYRDEVETLFRLMREEGLRIHITSEDYPLRPGLKSPFDKRAATVRENNDELLQNIRKRMYESMDKKDYIRARVMETPAKSSYHYTFHDPMMPQLKDRNLIDHIDDELDEYVERVLVPRGGGWDRVSGKKIMGLDVPKSVPEREVRELFRLMREKFINIDLTNEQYPRGRS